MSNQPSHFRELLKANGIVLDDAQWQMLNSFESLIRETNQKINLISRKAEDQIWSNHILHSLSLLKYVELPTEGHVCDLGCGGGFPGIPLAIVHPHLTFTLVDSIQKKIKAVQSMVESLGLSNAQAIAERAEVLGKQNEHKKKYSVVIARAVAPLNKLEEWSRGLRKPGARIITLKGGDLREEIKTLRSSKWVRSVKVFGLNIEGAPHFQEDEKKIVSVQFF